ncbi:hypothetical protein BU24DRAFT_468353 [Aaosphaeria arxii CBS 175.79]|uniref:Uncharacterized protein n=1 Tax=Aaosphaeria arxii CBS 175.79 TaxID=1450172 RepID=A0A6A5X7M4_9PLEO|nr:uncharacterized protein BU24DRAFT_468353 [Aaosphaeria arxii CBS 175.79]KAF2008943.1 hypothetical protein BU24DRAFT_468353 [Aaosphaeria arxii CBS 175.79]
MSSSQSTHAPAPQPVETNRQLSEKDSPTQITMHSKHNLWGQPAGKPESQCLQNCQLWCSCQQPHGEPTKPRRYSFDSHPIGLSFRPSGWTDRRQQQADERMHADMERFRSQSLWSMDHMKVNTGSSDGYPNYLVSLRVLVQMVKENVQSLIRMILRASKSFFARRT